MFWKKKEKKIIPWVDLNEMSHLKEITELSKSQPVLIFKHSTRCSISFMAKNRFEGGFEESEMAIWHLDLIRFRDISNAVAEEFNVLHASPQVLLIKNGKCTFTTSHNGISFNAIRKEL